MNSNRLSVVKYHSRQREYNDRRLLHFPPITARWTLTSFLPQKRHRGCSFEQDRTN